MMQIGKMSDDGGKMKCRINKEREQTENRDLLVCVHMCVCEYGISLVMICSY